MKKIMISAGIYVSAFLLTAQSLSAQHVPSHTLVAGDTNEMIWVYPGTYFMGSPVTEPVRQPNESQRKVSITYGFYMGRYEVTQGEYASIMNTNPSSFSSWHGSVENLSRPVEQASWNDAVEYCEHLTTYAHRARSIPEGWSYRLPTETEWEYVCRAGTTTVFPWGDVLEGGMINFDDHYCYNNGTIYETDPIIPQIFETTPVGSYSPNPWGFYDMNGNVWEWCQDIFDRGMYGDNRVMRGGSWRDPAFNCRSSARANGPVNTRGYDQVGFRIILAPDVPDWLNVIGNTVPHQPIYGACPIKEEGKDSLVLITHGWINPLEKIYQGSRKSVAWVDEMSNSIATYVTAHHLTNWQVFGYIWTNGAGVAFPETALNNAHQEGTALGATLNIEQWKHVHFIAHSAGSELIESATERIKTSGSDTVIQCTFLDPYVGMDYAGVTNYGALADWSDNYFSRDNLTGGEAYPLTESSLSNAFNVDVTQLDPTKIVYRSFSSAGGLASCYTTTSSHSWPIDFYSETITNPLAVIGFGFALSKEGSGWIKPQLDHSIGNTPPVMLGHPDPVCSSSATYSTTPEYIGHVINFSDSPVIQSGTGTIDAGGLQFSLITHSPSWITILVQETNTVNYISFDAQFLSVGGAEGVLNIYWDTNVIGQVDERTSSAHTKTYRLKVPTAPTHTAHVLGFRLDPFTSSSSVISITNVVVGYEGVSDPFGLSPLGYVSGHPVFQLYGKAGVDYTIQYTTNVYTPQWTDCAVLFNSTGTVLFTDPESTNDTIRLYRAVAPY